MSRGGWIVGAPVIAAALAALGWAGFTPIEVGSREAVFDIAQGTWARRRAGDPVEMLLDTIWLTLGLAELLLIGNHDDGPQTFGPTIMMPEQSFRLPFERAASYQFVCTAHASGQLTIDVEPEPATPWARIHWRAREWWEKHKK